MQKECPYCHIQIQYEKHQQIGGHLTNCKENPKRNEILEKNRTSHIKKKKFKLNCSKCNKEYIVYLSDQAFNKGKYKKYCSYSCSNSRVLSDQTRKNISKGHLNSEKCKLEHSKRRLDRPNCIVCGKQVKQPQHQHCSNACAAITRNTLEYKSKLSNIAKKRYKENPESHPNRRCAGLKESYPERCFREYIEKKGLIKNKHFEQQKSIKPYFVDFFFPILNLGIEIDGERWHDKNNEREIKRENYIKEKINLVRFKAKSLIKKEYQDKIDNIIDKVVGS